MNPLPGLSPGVSDLVFEAEAEGTSHAELINAILGAALERYPQLVGTGVRQPALATVP